MKPARWLVLAAAVGGTVITIVLALVLFAAEERRETLFAIGTAPPAPRSIDDTTCAGSARGTTCPDWWARPDRSPFPPRVAPPRVVRRVEPVYPPDARRARISGQVFLDVGIRRDGSVGGVCVLKPLPCGLDAAAEAAVRQWRFEPPRVDGRPADAVATIVVDLRP